MKHTTLFVLAVLATLAGCSSRTTLVPENVSTRGPIMISTTMPVYPPEAAEKNVEGTVLVKMWVDSTGRVSRALVQESPDPLLDRPALDAALGTRFRPAIFDGVPTGTWFIAPFEVRNRD